ncbi:MAG: hypothetical protein IJH82_10390 [Lachnospiraceae bacterium]|nr:hypothetical protein [Lachnospiraceae bacterium]
MNVEVIYSDGLKDIAEKTIKKTLVFKDSKCVKDEQGYALLDVGKAISCDSVIVFVTDDVVSDKEWNSRVESISSKKKIILMSLVKSVRLSEITPYNIRKINTIRINEEYSLDELWDVLLCDKDLYNVINTVAAMEEGWEASNKSELKLIHSVIEIFKVKRILKSGAKNENRPFFSNKIDKIMPYLKVSQKTAIMNLLRRSVNAFSTASFIFLAAVFIYASVKKIPQYFNAAAKSTAICGMENYTLYAPVQTLKAIEVLRNPLVNTSLKKDALEVLNECLADNWPNTPIGVNYKYALNDAYVCDDERYIITACGNGQCNKWDTYTGKISEYSKVSKSPLYVIDCINGEKNRVAVDEAGTIYYFTDGKWMETGSSVSDCGYANGISLSEYGFTVKTNQEVLLVYSLSGNQVSFVNSYSFDQIYGFEQNNNATLVMAESDGKFIACRIGSDGAMSTLESPGKEPDTLCNADIKNGNALYADKTGRLNIYHFESEKNEPLDTVLSFPVCLQYVNDTTLFYCDRNKGNCLYDYAHGLDLGNFLEESGNTSYAVCKGDTVACSSSGVIYSENVCDLLPKEEIDTDQIVSKFDSGVCTAAGLDTANEGNSILKAEIFCDKYVMSRLKDSNGDEFNYLIDGGHNYLYTGMQQKSNYEELSNADWTFSYYSQVFYTGKPTVIGIVDGETLLVGSSDGNFYEVYSNGDVVQMITHKKLASASEVESICLMKDGYFYIKDTKGLYWKARYGSKSSISYNALYEEVNNKLHMAMTDEIKYCVSDLVKDVINFEYMPGHDGKEWK